MKKKFFLLYTNLMIVCFSFCQNTTKWPIWYIPSQNITINGLAIGPVASWIDYEHLTKVNGIRLELIGFGIIMPLAPKMSFDDCNKDSICISSKQDSAINKNFKSICNGISLSTFGSANSNEKINGIQISFMCSYTDMVNGITLGLIFGNITKILNGFSFGGLSNMSIEVNGVQSAILRNEAYETQGVQIGGLNKSHSLKGMQIGVFNQCLTCKGFQIGLWNKNSKRSLPIINWDFTE